MVQKLNYDPRTVPPPHTLMYPFPYQSVTDDTVPHGWRKYEEVVVARPHTGFRDIQCQVRISDHVRSTSRELKGA